MKKRRYENKLIKKLRNIESEAITIAAIIEIIKDSCSNNDYTNQEIVADIALKKQYKLVESISILY